MTFNLKIRPIVAGLALLILIVLAFHNQKAIASQLNAWNLLPKPETFTELYFENHINLPKTIVRGQNYTFSFTIHNLEYRSVVYPYKVYIQRGETIVPLEDGSITLNQDGYQTVSVEFGSLENLRSMIVVELTDKKQKIDFWVEAI